jgi:hypothetical protein
MAGPGNGTGKSGKSFNDRVLAAKVRTLTLEEIKKVLERETMDEFKKALILKLASNILPRLTELTGEDGEPIQGKVTVEFVNAA